MHWRLPVFSIYFRFERPLSILDGGSQTCFDCSASIYFVAIQLPDLGSHREAFPLNSYSDYESKIVSCGHAGNYINYRNFTPRKYWIWYGEPESDFQWELKAAYSVRYQLTWEINLYLLPRPGVEPAIWEVEPGLSALKTSDVLPLGHRGSASSIKTDRFAGISAENICEWSGYPIAF